jgi:para-aminobenzoate synthetase component 1
MQNLPPDFKRELEADFRGKTFFVHKIKNFDLHPLLFFEVVREVDASILYGGDTGLTYMMANPVWRISFMCQDMTVETPVGMHHLFRVGPDHALELLEYFLSLKPNYQEECNFPFAGGAVGYFSYDFGARINGFEPQAIDELLNSECYFMFPRDFYVYNHETRELQMWHLHKTQEDADKRFALIKRRMKKMIFAYYEKTKDFIDPYSKVWRHVFEEGFYKIKEQLQLGNTYEVNYARRYQGHLDINSWMIFRKLAETNPSPFSCYLDFAICQIVCNSPERLVSLRDGILETKPIKGTVRRGSTEKQEKKFAEMLLKSEKEEAEMNMIVDLARNDLGKISEVGSVEVVKHREIEKYSHVQHAVSTIRSVKRKDATLKDIIYAMFPGGSVTGAPKVRTMKIIDEVEKYRRGLYCGSAGYLSFNGNLDLNIMIRTMTFFNDDYYFHSGGAIVADSVYEEELKEVQNKAKAIMAALYTFDADYVDDGFFKP